MNALATEPMIAEIPDSHHCSAAARFAQTLAGVCGKITPVWPLDDYVAMNPYAGFADQTLIQCHQSFRRFCDGTLLMPMHYYAAQFSEGKVTRSDIAEAIRQTEESLVDSSELPSLAEIVFTLNQSLRRQASVIEFGTKNEPPEGRWGTAIIEEISRHCSAHYDQGQATWASPFRSRSLYDAWREMMKLDRKFEWMGVSQFRQFVSELPDDPADAILALLIRLNVPESQWESFLLSRAFTVPGWSAWAKYQGVMAERSGGIADEDLIGLLAIRLAYDTALGHPISYCDHLRSEPASADVWVRTILLRATEIAIQNRILESIKQARLERPLSTVSNAASIDPATSDTAKATNPLAQMVFCIDVRSERIRRHIEAVTSGIETFGFAGFFGLPIEFVPLGRQSGSGQVPVLLTPQFQVHETIAGVSDDEVETAAQQRAVIRSWRKSWKQFATSAVGCFSFVETTGLLSAGSLLSRTLRIDRSGWRGPSNPSRDAIGPNHQLRLTLANLEEQGITLPKRIEMATAVLTNLGITRDFARLVVFCGHASQTENNPLQAGLDCGACGGHSGESNARFAAMLINQPAVRAGLAETGIVIPESTHFLPAVHNTTTDEIVFYDLQDVPASHQNDLKELQEGTAAATRLTQAERMPLVASDSITDLLRRSLDWSEVRPEWGLAGNAAFIAAPRTFTESIDLNGRAFLHSYDESADPHSQVLETIMTAPLVVAHLINMQYYASTVDNEHFGSGSKTVHNIVGGFGVLSGNGGDLQTGLPIQSLHDGKKWIHEPVRLLGILAAHRSAIDGVLAKHAGLRQSILNGWLNLIAIEDGQPYRCTHTGQWEAV
ncbi:YbcC family protein [Neorhodopirellula pilleata]|uniref:Probable inorganic carbon transporter subunit DabA n=1 Tax=Neorhodopirellula pilleata TaxID=2714738 RepID=A0A5C6AWR0_9BACT|nr:DUF2309 domain-containing protein [Neorhodopirellula pilleata]TWU03579.1 hypothetical protein Pla100_05060 [Neorhodopirellula pilleata]